MQIESVIEDLEAQGFFSQQTSKQKPEPETVITAKVMFLEPNIPEIQLLSPVSGKDFFAGFSKQGPGLRWWILPQFAEFLIEADVRKGLIPKTKLALNKFLRQKFLGLEVSIALKYNSGQITGRIARVCNSLIEIESQRTKIWISLSAINAITVDNLERLF